MQFKEAIKFLHKEVAVVPPWAYVHKSNKNAESIDESRVVKAVLLSEQGYHPTTSYDHPDENGNWNRQFHLASESERVKGLFFESEDSSGQKTRFVVRASEVIGLWSEVEPRFAERQKRQAEAQAERERTRAIIAEAEARLESTVVPMRESIVASVSRLLNKPVDDSIVSPSISVSGYWDDPQKCEQYNAVVTGKVTLRLDEFQQLLEEFLEAQDELEDLREQVAQREEVNA